MVTSGEGNPAVSVSISQYTHWSTLNVAAVHLHQGSERILLLMAEMQTVDLSSAELPVAVAATAK